MKKIIASRQNPDFKKLLGIVGFAKDRHLSALAWVEGDRLCNTFLAHQRPILVAVPAVADALINQYQDQCSEIWVLDEKLFKEISQVQAAPGWGLIVSIPAHTPRANPAVADVVILDSVADPGNAGTLLRSAAAAGIEEVWALAGTVDLWSPKVLRAAMGAHVALHLVENLNPEQCLQLIHDRSATLYATALSDQAQSLYSKANDFGKPCAWVFGQEAAGVRPEILKVAKVVMIPQASGVESLNVAAAAAICLFEMRRQRISAQY